MSKFRLIEAGDTAPNVIQRTPSSAAYRLDSAAGRYLVLCFCHSAQGPAADRLTLAAKRPDLFDDAFAAFFAVSSDPADEAEGRLANRLPGFRVFWDFDRALGRAYGASELDAPNGILRGLWVVIDPGMRVAEVIPFEPDGSDMARMEAVLDALPRPGRHGGIEIPVPILYLPRVFEPELCHHLIGLYDAQGGEMSGVMREVGGKTVGIHDARQKVRRDIVLEDQDLIGTLQNRILRRVVPQIEKVHMFRATRMERYIVSCYDATEGGHFAPHRDNTTSGTAHRRFAVSINLNDDFDGGEVSFPEYGPRGFKAPAGGAVVFSCALLHSVSRVTRGRRYAFLPFLYDEAAAKIRAENLHRVDGAGAVPAPAR